MANKQTKKFNIGDKVRFYVKRFRKWYEGKVESLEESGDLKGCYNIRVTKAEGKFAMYEVGHLWVVEPCLMENL